MLEQIEIHFSIAVGFLGLLVVSILLWYRKSNPLINSYLFIILLFASLRLLDQGIFELYGYPSFFVTIYWAKPILLIAIPSFYLYFKNILTSTQGFEKNHLLHFLYPFFNIVFYVLQSKNLMLQDHYVPMLQKAGIFVYLVYYFIKTLTLIYKKLYKKTEKDNISTNQLRLIKKWSLFFFGVALLLLIRLLFALLLESGTGETFIGYTFSLLHSVLWLGLFVKIISSAEILHGYQRLNNRILLRDEPTQTSPEIWDLTEPTILNLQDAKLQTIITKSKEAYIQEIITFVDATFPFRKSEYSLHRLAKDLKIPKSHLVFIFKYHCKLSFVGFKKYCRVKDSLHLIHTNYLDSKTYEALSKKVGFVSYNPFYDSFKKYTHQSPKDFLSSQTTDDLI